MKLRTLPHTAFARMFIETHVLVCINCCMYTQDLPILYYTCIHTQIIRLRLHAKQVSCNTSQEYRMQTDAKDEFCVILHVL